MLASVDTKPKDEVNADFVIDCLFEDAVCIKLYYHDLNSHDLNHY